MLLSDSATQFRSSEFARFAKTWRFKHETSSPHYPRSNGQAEAAVKVAKAIMKKAKASGTDVYIALLDYRNTPHSATGLSPAEVMVNRKMRSCTLPQHQPARDVDVKAKETKDRHQRMVKATHDRRAKPLPQLHVGDRVWFTEFRGAREKWSRGSVVICNSNGRSYIVEAEAGGLFERNRVHIRPDKTEPQSNEDSDDDDDCFDCVDYKPRDNANNTRNEDLRDHTIKRRDVGYGFVPPLTTRSGRVIKPVK